MIKKLAVILFAVLMPLNVSAQWNTSGSDIYYNSGDVGIGTNNPLERLHLVVSSGLGSERFLIESASQSGNAFLEIDANANRRSGVIFSTAGTEAWTIGRSDSDEISGGKFYIATGHSGGNNSKLVIEPSGKVGIGTTSPNAELDVMGELKLEGGNQDFSISSIDETDGDFDQFINYGGIAINGNSGSNRQMYMFTDGGNSHNVFSVVTSQDGGSSWHPRFVIQQDGDIGIGTTSSDEKLTVAGTGKFQEVIVDEDAGADFVFEEDYNLPDLSELEAYIKAHKHLPEIPTAEQMKAEGVKVGELQMKLLQKIEELTLYLIEQKKTIDIELETEEEQNQLIKSLIMQNEQLLKRIEQLEEENE